MMAMVMMMMMTSMTALNLGKVKNPSGGGRRVSPIGNSAWRPIHSVADLIHIVIVITSLPCRHHHHRHHHHHHHHHQKHLRYTRRSRRRWKSMDSEQRIHWVGRPGLNVIMMTLTMIMIMIMIMMMMKRSTWPRDLGSVAELRCDGGNILLNWYSYSGSENIHIILYHHQHRNHHHHITTTLYVLDKEIRRLRGNFKGGFRRWVLSPGLLSPTATSSDDDRVIIIIIIILILIIWSVI